MPTWLRPDSVVPAELRDEMENLTAEVNELAPRLVDLGARAEALEADYERRIPTRFGDEDAREEFRVAAGTLGYTEMRESFVDCARILAGWTYSVG